MNRWRICNTLMIVAGASIAAQSSVSAACWYPDEIQADQVKDFQYMMMVGSLQCSNGSRPSREAYNAFVNSKRGVLDSKGYVLKAHFLRENGIQDGRAAYDRSATTMSNRHAGRFDDASFCATISSYTRMAVTASDADFITLAQSVIEPPSGSCAASGYNPPVVAASPPVRRTESAYAPKPYSSEPYARSATYPNDVNYPLPGNAPEVAAPEPAVLQEAYATPLPPLPGPTLPEGAPLLQPLPVAEAAPVAAPIPVAAPVKAARAIPVAAHTTMIANAPIVPPIEAAAATPSAADALQAAITALQAATDALKAQAHPSN